MSRLAVRSALLASILAVPALVAGCAGEPTPAEEVASVEVALTTVPSGVQCVRVTVNVAGQNISPPAQTVAPGTSSASLSIGTLPAGAATFNGSAFNLPCSMVAQSTTPAWIADPAIATLGPGVLSTVALTFRRNNAVSVGANFVDNVVEIIVGGQATYARMSDGTVKQWGYSGDRRSPTPAVVTGLSGSAQVVGGDGYACSRNVAGNVSCWGASGQGGVLGPGLVPELLLGEYDKVLRAKGGPAEGGSRG